MYRNILIPVTLDDSRDTAAALAAGKALADPGAQLTLLHVIEAIPLYIAEMIPPEAYLPAREGIRAQLEEMAKDLPQCGTLIEEGRPGPSICRIAEDHDCDCIVMASHQPAFTDILLGSVAQHVVRHATCPVLVLR